MPRCLLPHAMSGLRKVYDRVIAVTDKEDSFTKLRCSIVHRIHLEDIHVIRGLRTGLEILRE